MSYSAIAKLRDIGLTHNQAICIFQSLNNHIIFFWNKLFIGH